MADLRVALRCDFISGGNIGGVEQFVVGLIRSLSEHSDGDIEYVLVTHPRDPDWLRPYASESMEIVPRPWASRVEQIRAHLGPLERVLVLLAEPFFSDGGTPSVGDESDFYERLNVDLVHHPTQNFVETGRPSVYNPWDIQHVRYPEFFSEEQIEWRETIYRAGCERAEAVEVPTSVVEENISEEYGVDPAKIHVIYPGPPAGVHSASSEERTPSVRDEYDLPDEFLFYPATTWPHKNHERLIEAIAHLDDTLDRNVPLVCVGKRTEHWERVEATVADSSVADRVHFLGYVDNDIIGSFYRAAIATVFPSLYEGLGMPVLESWQYETPVCCSDISPLSDITGDAAIRFDPRSPVDIANKIDSLLSDERLQADLVSAGQTRLEVFSWERAVREHESLYRSVAE